MIRIGDFARLGRVSVETLRHYDEIGLLPPARVDPGTGYRLYEPAQLAILFRILALKDLGFSLARISELLADAAPGDLQRLLMVARDQAEADVVAANDRFTRITARLQQLQEEQAMPAYEVILKDTTTQLLATRRITVPSNDQVGDLLGRAFETTYTRVRSAGAKDTGPCQAIWHQPAAVLANEVVEAAVPIDRPIPSTEDVIITELPACKVASVIHHGPFSTMSHAHAAILSWLGANGYESDSTYREVYIHDSPDPAQQVTEIQYPVVRAGAS